MAGFSDSFSGLQKEEARRQKEQEILRKLNAMMDSGLLDPQEADRYFNAIMAEVQANNLDSAAGLLGEMEAAHGDAKAQDIATQADNGQLGQTQHNNVNRDPAQGAVGDEFTPEQISGTYGQMDDARWEANAKAEALRLIKGEGLPTADSLYQPQARTIKENAINLAGAEAANLARRGLSRSGFQQRSIQTIGRNKDKSLADASLSAEKQARDIRTQASEQGANMLSGLHDLELSKANQANAEKNQTELNNKAAKDTEASKFNFWG